MVSQQTRTLSVTISQAASLVVVSDRDTETRLNACRTVLVHDVSVMVFGVNCANPFVHPHPPFSLPSLSRSLFFSLSTPSLLLLSLSVSLSLSVTLSLFLCLSVCLSVCLSLCLSLSLPPHPPTLSHPRLCVKKVPLPFCTYLRAGQNVNIYTYPPLS